jgi:hypothetical protein
MTNQTTVEFYSNREEQSNALSNGVVFRNPFDKGSWKKNLFRVFGANSSDSIDNEESTNAYDGNDVNSISWWYILMLLPSRRRPPPPDYPFVIDSSFQTLLLRSIP